MCFFGGGKALVGLVLACWLGAAVPALRPQQGYDLSPIMLWRPQKVGSSTILPILESFSFRMNLKLRPPHSMNDLCKQAARCAAAGESDPRRKERLEAYAAGVHPGAGATKKPGRRSRSPDVPFSVSLTHEMCSFGSQNTLHANMKCAFKTEQAIKQFIILREPISRAISVYYFWGELFRLRRGLGNRRREKKRKEIGTRDNATTSPVPGLFIYHGDEDTVPADDVAMDFAKRLPYRVGMPGPSFTWSAFSSTVDDAIGYLSSGAVLPVLLERMDESLVVLSHYLGWSLADVLVVKPRKALSKHPSASKWPAEAIAALSHNLHTRGEFKFYEVAADILNSKIAELKASSIDVDMEVSLLRQLRSRVSEHCLQRRVLAEYRKFLSAFLPQNERNHLRDVETEYVADGHSFTLDDHLFYSFDLCGSCEAHAILLSMTHNPALSVNDSASLLEIDANLRKGHIPLLRCPK